MTGGAVSVVTVNGNQYLQITYTGGSVAGGSFATPSGVMLSVTSNQGVAQLSSECANGSHSISFHGSLTL